MRLIDMTLVLLHYVIDTDIRKFSRFDVPMHAPILTKVIFCLVELVKGKISVEMKDTHGAILFDGWSCNDTYYMAVIASYYPFADDGLLSECTMKEGPRLSYLNMYPTGKFVDSDGKCTSHEEKTTRFSAESHVQFLRIFLNFLVSTLMSGVCVSLQTTRALMSLFLVSVKIQS